MKYWNTTRCYKIKHLAYTGEDMEVGYEEKFDDLVIMLSDDYEYDRSIEIEAGFIVDVDKKGKLCAIEIVGCSKRINKSKKYIKNAKIEAFVEIYDFSYMITIDFNNGEAKISQRVLK